MIHYISPYSTTKNFGGAINKAIESIKYNQDDWICLTDADVAFLHPEYGHRLENVIKDTKYDLITCVTNRLRSNDQTLQHMFNEMDLSKHYEKYEICKKLKGDTIEDYYMDVAGFFMLFRVSHWEKFKFEENTATFDRFFSRTFARGKVGIMRGLYVLHMYRLWSKDPKNDVTHLLQKDIK